MRRTFIFFQPLFTGALAILIASFMSGSADLSTVRAFYMLPRSAFYFVWLLFYLVIGYSAYRVSEKSNLKVVEAIRWFHIHLFTHFLWIILYLGLRFFFYSFIAVLSSFVAIILTLRAFKKLDSYSFYLVSVYTAWIAYVSYLNFLVVY